MRIKKKNVEIDINNGDILSLNISNNSFPMSDNNKNNIK